MKIPKIPQEPEQYRYFIKDHHSPGKPYVGENGARFRTLTYAKFYISKRSAELVIRSKGWTSCTAEIILASFANKYIRQRHEG